MNSIDIREQAKEVEQILIAALKFAKEHWG